MTTTITYSDGSTIRPMLVLLGSADVEVTSRSLTHEILDGPPVYTLRPTRPQTGTIKLLFGSSAAAHAARGALTAADVYTVSSDDDAALNLRFLVRTVRAEQHDEATSIWTITIDYEAVG